MTDDIVLYSGRTITNVHPEGTCLGEFCCIHKPSDHPLNAAPMEWDPFTGMTRVCEHEFFHPDPDDLNFKMLTGQWTLVEAISSVHLMEENCDDCCRRPLSQGVGNDSEGAS